MKIPPFLLVITRGTRFFFNNDIICVGKTDLHISNKARSCVDNVLQDKIQIANYEMMKQVLFDENLN